MSNNKQDTKTPTEAQCKDYAADVAGFPLDETTTYSVLHEHGTRYGVLTTGDYCLQCWLMDSGEVYGEW